MSIAAFSPQPAQWIRAVKNRLFADASWRYVAPRMAIDLFAAHTVLVAAAALRLAIYGRITLDNSVSTLLERVNSLYFLHAGWFCATAVILFSLVGLYRPLRSSMFLARLKHVGRACMAGLVLHLGFGILVLGGGQAVFQVAFGAWGLLCLTVAGIRISRMYVGSKYRLVPRGSAVRSKTEDVLVVGGAGYIGSILTRQLLESGYGVRVLDLELFGRQSIADVAWHPRLDIMKGDFRNTQDVVRALRGMDAVVHLAAIVGDPACALDRETTIAINYAAAKMMAQVCRAQGVSRFVFASTCSVYGASDEMRYETSNLNPVSLYATTKVDAEQVLLDSTDDVFQPTILRFATAYGWSYRPRFDLVANLFSAQAVTEQLITIVNGEQWRPFVHTKDIARACVMSLEAPLKLVGGQVFNVGDESQNFTLEQLGEIVAASAPGTRVAKVKNQDDPRNYRVCFEKIRRALGFRAQVTLQEGIQEMVDAVRAGKVKDWRDPVHSNVKHLQGEGLRNLRIFNSEEQTLDITSATGKFLARAA